MWKQEGIRRGGWEPRQNETEWQRENKRQAGKVKQQEGRDNQEGDHGTGQEWEVGKQWERKNGKKRSREPAVGKGWGLLYGLAKAGPVLQ